MVAKSKKKINQVKNTHETEKSLMGQFSDSVKKDLGQGAVDDLWEQLLGTSLKKGKAQEAQTANDVEQNAAKFADKGDIFSKSSTDRSEIRKASPEIAAAIDYHGEVARQSENTSKKEVHQMNTQIQEVMIELRQLINSSKVLQMEFAGIAVEDKPPVVGKYHVNFFEWMLIAIRSAREKVEDSGAWLQAMKGKGKSKNYWGMFKKHGTTFGLSGERAVATQVG